MASIITPSVDLKCPICLELMFELVQLNPCGHHFHSVCIRKWMNDGPAPVERCPTCHGAFDFRHSWFAKRIVLMDEEGVEKYRCFTCNIGGINRKELSIHIETCKLKTKPTLK